jgi:hypothetical protein
MKLCALILMVVAACGGGKKADGSGEGSSTAGSATAPAGDAVAAFWTWFQKNAAELHAEADLRKVMERISAELAKVDKDVFAEIGGDAKTRMLVISVDGKKALFPKVQAIQAAAPAVDGWKIVAFRQRSTPGDMAKFQLGGKTLDPAQIKLVAKADGDKLDIDVYMPSFTNHDEMAQIGFIVLDHTVGEYDMETRIGAIEFLPIEKAPAAARPLADLPAIVDALK